MSRVVMLLMITYSNWMASLGPVHLIHKHLIFVCLSVSLILRPHHLNLLLIWFNTRLSTHRRIHPLFGVVIPHWIFFSWIKSLPRIPRMLKLIGLRAVNNVRSLGKTPLHSTKFFFTRHTRAKRDVLFVWAHSLSLISTYSDSLMLHPSFWGTSITPHFAITSYLFSPTVHLRLLSCSSWNYLGRVQLLR